MDGQVAAGKVFGGGVGEENVGGITGASRDDRILAGVGDGGQVGASRGYCLGVFGKGAAQVAKPLGLGMSVIVDVGNEFTATLFRSMIAGDGEA